MKAGAYIAIGILILIVVWMLFGAGLFSLQPMEPSDEVPTFRGGASHEPGERDNDHRERGGPTRRDGEE